MSFTAIIGGLVAFVKAVPIIDGWVQQFLALYITTQTAETLSKINDAAAFTARAQTDEDRYKAADMWRAAMQRPRVSK